MSHAAIAEQRVEIAGMWTRILTVDGDGPPVLLFHGFSDSSDTWCPVLEALSLAGRRAVALDLPGSGRASALGRPPLAHLDRVADAFITKYSRGEPAILAGNSLGGLVALRAAGRDLPIGAVAGLGPAGLAYGKRLNQLSATAKRIDAILEPFDRVRLPRPLLRAILARTYNKRLGGGVSDPELGRRFARFNGTVPSLARLRKDLIALDGDESILTPQQLAAIKVPVLLIWGEEDPLADPDGAQVLLQAVPNSSLLLLPDVGHCAQLEVPDLVADSVLSLPTLPGDTP